MQSVLIAASLCISCREFNEKAEAWLQPAHGEARCSARYVGHNGEGLGVVHLHGESLGQASIEALRTLDVEGLGSLVHNAAVVQGIWFSCSTTDTSASANFKLLPHQKLRLKKEANAYNLTRCYKIL